MDGILDNQEVTADVLNAISVDLGGDGSKFSATEKFGADKLNSITGDLAGPGVLFSGNCCNVTVSEGKIYVQDGIIVFNSGAKKTIPAAIEIGNTMQTKQYIYAYNNTYANMIQLIAAEEAPSVGDYVMLAEVTGTTVIDKRTVSFSKVGKGTTVIEKHTFSGNVTPTEDYTECWRVQTNIESPKLLILNLTGYDSDKGLTTATRTYDCEQELWYKDGPIRMSWANFPRSLGGSQTTAFCVNCDSGWYRDLRLLVSVTPGEIIFYSKKDSPKGAIYTDGFSLAII